MKNFSVVSLDQQRNQLPLPQATSNNRLRLKRLNQGWAQSPWPVPPHNYERLSQLTHLIRAYPSFSSMKWLSVLLIPCGQNASPWLPPTPPPPPSYWPSAFGQLSLKVCQNSFKLLDGESWTSRSKTQHKDPARVHTDTFLLAVSPLHSEPLKLSILKGKITLSPIDTYLGTGINSLFPLIENLLI